MKRLSILLLAMLALSACDTPTDRTNAEAARLSAQSQLTQAQAQQTRAESDAATARALVDVNNARADDLQLIVWASVGLAGLSMAVSIALVFVMARIARTPAQIVYQVQASQQAQLEPRYTWPAEEPWDRARRRAIQAQQQVINRE